jgi:pimeloyl-ACP methyl ester carboxylesterase
MPPQKTNEFHRYVHQVIGGIEVKIIIFKDSGHLPWLEKPELFYKVVDDFFSGNWPVNALKVK